MSTRKETIIPIQGKEWSVCYHCGDQCREDTIHLRDKVFCCEGCKLVFEILNENNLGTYYSLNNAPGKKDRKQKKITLFDYLDDEKIKQQLITFTDGNINDITLVIPQIHCSSCIWLLEHLYKLDSGIKRATVNFLKREVHIVYREQETTFRKIAELLDRIGYTPYISLDNAQDKKIKATNHKSYYKLGVAFFSFGNIMLLSFPEYLGLHELQDIAFINLFGYLNILLSLPVLLYADTDFFKSAITGLKQGRLNMDFPISLGIIVMYSRSLYEILSGSGAGYMDSFAALIFFMLSGRLFQNKSFERLSFERDYKSYFPIAITVVKNGNEISKAISEIHRGDRILIRNEELIPADSVLIHGEANIDYSFVTGENIPVPKKIGDRIYAGGKQLGTSLELEVIKEIAQSRLTQLWNESNYCQLPNKNSLTIADRVSKYFTVIVLLIATAAAGWYLYNLMPAKAMNAFTAILIITCPCALALSYPFTLGNSIRILGNQKFYLKNTGIIEKLSQIDTIVFDKTGTLTRTGIAEIKYTGCLLSEKNLSQIHSLTSQSTHPLSRLLTGHLKSFCKLQVQEFREFPGMGIQGIINGELIRLGSSTFVGNSKSENISSGTKAIVHISIAGSYLGGYEITSQYREGLEEVTSQLKVNYDLHLLSGDNHAERKKLSAYFDNEYKLQFEQSPADKLKFIKTLQLNNRKVLMLGDGLNDAGALLQSNVGIAISESVNNFSPASDGILDADVFKKIPSFLNFAKSSMRIILMSYIISLLYNCIGIYFAIQGNLSPVIAAIIMPLSTVTIILFTTFSCNLSAFYHKVSN